jgi:hypothetical protein
MSIRINSIIMSLNVLWAVAFILGPSHVFAACDYEPDAPDCACFDATGAWDPVGAFIQDVATATVGTKVACVADGGKPYYQMVLGCNSPAEANLMSFLLAWPAWDWGIAEREAWCSEAISYWHRETGIPYWGGYSTPWHTDWQVSNVGSLKTWYMTEELLGGRGRWIDPEDVDYDDFHLGVTAPVPGAYVGIRDYNTSTNTWLDSNTHSLMINELWIHEDAIGNVFRLEATLLEGNSSSQVKNTRHWDDILSLTPQGTGFVSGIRKIYGFGVDLNSDGQPLYDASRLHYVVYPVILDKPRTIFVATKDPLWPWYHQRLLPLVTYAKLLQSSGGPKVMCSDPSLKIQHLPDGRAIQWFFPKGQADKAEILIDLLDVHPLPIHGMELRWDGRSLPWNYKVQFAGADQKFSDAVLPKPFQGVPPGQSPSIPVPVLFSTSGKGVPVRYVKLIVQSAFEEDAALENLRFRYEQGPLQDKEDPCQYILAGDLNHDCRITILDFARMAENWLIDCNVASNPECVPE